MLLSQMGDDQTTRRDRVARNHPRKLMFDWGPPFFFLPLWPTAFLFYGAGRSLRTAILSEGRSP